MVPSTTSSKQNTMDYTHHNYGGHHMGRRRKRKTPTARVQRRLPKIFTCPNCGKDAIRIQYDRDRTSADVSCGACKIQATISTNSLMEAIDVFGDFIDRYDSGDITREPQSDEVEVATLASEENPQESTGFFDDDRSETEP